MRRIYVPASGLSDWQALLADPELHWKRGRSAFELAVKWELAARNLRGMPPLVADLLDQCTGTQGATLLLAAPEHKVSLDGRGKPSQTDLWALLRNENGLVSLAVEGKAGEPFDKTVAQWRGETANRSTRLHGLCSILKLDENNIDDLHYQLLHRTASAVLEARRFGAPQAVLLVQSFDGAAVGIDAFSKFADRMGAAGIKSGQLAAAKTLDAVQLWLGWLDCPLATDAEIASLSA